MESHRTGPSTWLHSYIMETARGRGIGEDARLLLQVGFTRRAHHISLSVVASLFFSLTHPAIHNTGSFLFFHFLEHYTPYRHHHCLFACIFMVYRANPQTSVFSESAYLQHFGWLPLFSPSFPSFVCGGKTSATLFYCMKVAGWEEIPIASFGKTYPACGQSFFFLFLFFVSLLYPIVLVCFGSSSSTAHFVHRNPEPKRQERDGRTFG